MLDFLARRWPCWWPWRWAPRFVRRWHCNEFKRVYIEIHHGGPDGLAEWTYQEQASGMRSGRMGKWHPDAELYRVNGMLEWCIPRLDPGPPVISFEPESDDS